MSHDQRHILALETSGQTGSVAIGTTAGVVAAERLPVDVRHAGELMPAVQRLLNAQDWPADSITDVFVSIGPGSFTGLRIAVSVARTLAWSVGARVVAVPTMHALARNALAADPQPAHVAMIVDAKRSQVCTACYRIEPDRCAEVVPRVWPSREVPARVARNRWPFWGRASRVTARPSPPRGQSCCPNRCGRAGRRTCSPSAWRWRTATKYTPARDLVPLYIRRPEMEERWEARQARSSAAHYPTGNTVGSPRSPAARTRTCARALLRWP